MFLLRDVDVLLPLHSEIKLNFGLDSHSLSLLPRMHLIWVFQLILSRDVPEIMWLWYSIYRMSTSIYSFDPAQLAFLHTLSIPLYCRPQHCLIFINDKLWGNQVWKPLKLWGVVNDKYYHYKRERWLYKTRKGQMCLFCYFSIYSASQLGFATKYERNTFGNRLFCIEQGPTKWTHINCKSLYEMFLKKKKTCQQILLPD